MDGSIGWDHVIFPGGFWCQKKNQLFRIIHWFVSKSGRFFFRSMADGFREKKMPLQWIDPNGRQLEWSFVTLFFWLQLECWQKGNHKLWTKKGNRIGFSLGSIIFKKKPRSTLTASPRSFFGQGAGWTVWLFLLVFARQAPLSPFITCSRKIGNLFPFFNSFKNKMDKFLEYVEKHQNDFVERLRKAVAIPR